MTYEDLKRVNEECKTTPVKDKPYIEVNERIKAFRKLFPMVFKAIEQIERRINGESSQARA